MKRKMRKFDDGGKVYDKEDEGIFGNKIKYREEDGRKYVAGTPNAMDRNPREQRYYSVDDVKSKLSGLFGGKKEDSSSKFDELESVGGAGRRPRTIEEQIGRKAEDKPAGKLYVNQEYKEDTSEPATKKKSASASSKAASSGFPKDTKSTRMPSGYEKIDTREKASIPKDTKSTRMPSGYDKLDVSEKPSVGKDATPMKKEEGKGFSTRMGKTPEEREAQAKANREAVADSVSGITKYFRNPFAGDDEEKPKKKTFERRLNVKPTADQMKKMAKGGSVKSSASSRGDGCAVRGKTKGRIY